MKKFLTYFGLFIYLSLHYNNDSLAKAIPSAPKKRLIKILTIDGGGVVGIVPATLLAFIEKGLKNKKNLAECFDLMAGTSTGGLIVFMLSTPNGQNKPLYTAQDVLKNYITLAPQIFEQTFFQWLITLDGWIDEKYSSENFQRLLQEYIGNRYLSETLTHVLVPAYDIMRNQVIYFTSENARKNQFNDFCIRDVARATSAAPTYFAPAEIWDRAHHKRYTLIDGGIAVQNPALAALIHAVQLFGKNNDFLLVSLGGGANYGDPDDEKIIVGGKLQWAGKIVPLFMSASSDVVTRQIQMLSAGDSSRQYYRFQIILDTAFADLDNTDPENIATLQRMGEELVLRHEKELQQIISLLDDVP